MERSESFDFLHLLDDSLPSLLSESLSDIPHLHYLDDPTPVPPFPIRPVRPIPPLLVYRRSNLLPLTSDVRDLSITVSSLTVPRIASLLHEPVCITQWLEEIIPLDPPGDIPWGGVRPTKTEVWRPQGSLFSPSDFRKALKAARTPVPIRHPRRPTPSSTLTRHWPRVSTNKQPHREALVFKREITLNSEGKPKRLSLEIPAATMDPEIVDIMLELQDLSLFFKNGLQDVQDPGSAAEEKKIHPPSLVISDSHNTIPIVLDSSPCADNDPPISLATRRGKGLLPPLSITSANQVTVGTSYPSIPSAFMGTPSAYSPKFEGAATDESSLEDMIATLRSKVTYPPQSANLNENSEVVESPVSPMSFASLSEQVDNEDDWAFAVSLLAEFGSEPEEIIGKLDLIDNPKRCPRKEELGSKLLSVAENFATLSSSTTVENTSLCFTLSPAPGTPLPSTPALPSPAASNISPPASPTTPTPVSGTPFPTSVRGILKSCKNVRFASLPERPNNLRIDPLIIDPPSPPITSQLRRPLRTRTIYRTSRAFTDTAHPPRSPVTPTPVTSYVHTPPVPGPTTIPNPSTSSTDHSQPPPNPVLSQTASPPHPSTTFTSARNSSSILKRTSTTATASARKSISLGKTAKTSDADKENVTVSKPKTASKPKPVTTSRWTMNDMTFRRGSGAGQLNPSEGTPKSRMPVPLRNIWTRLK